MTQIYPILKRPIRGVTALLLLLSLLLISGCADIGEPIQSVPAGGNVSPVLLSIGERYAAVNNAFVLVVSASDSESTPTLTAMNLPATATFVDSGNGRGLFSWTPMPIFANSVQAVTFVATDDSMASVSETVALNVIDYTFNNFVSPQVATHCKDPGCHSSADSNSGYSVDSYTSFIAGGLVAGNGIIPKDTSASVVFQKLGMSPPFASPMPLGAGRLPQSTLDSLARWILAGAPEF